MDANAHQYTPSVDLTLEILMKDIAHEVSDGSFVGRIHGRNDVYRDGCRGPLCRYRERTRKREAREARTRASLPGGVQPMRRTRTEQRWDLVIEETLDQIRTLGVQQWLDARDAVRVTMSVSPVAGAPDSGLAHQKSGASSGESVAVHLLPVATTSVPKQRRGDRS